VTNGADWEQKWAIALLREKTLMETTACPMRCQMERTTSDAVCHLKSSTFPCSCRLLISERTILTSIFKKILVHNTCKVLICLNQQESSDMLYPKQFFYFNLLLLKIDLWQREFTSIV
jgi:uncharacterized Fe-S radical SAM superfamily protein PflX